MHSSDDNSDKKWGAATHSIHGRQDKAYLSPTFPIYQTSTFAVAESGDFAPLLDGTAEDAFVYTRYGNPTIANVQEKLAAIHHAEVGFLFGSGMAAIAAAILSQVKAGDTVAAIRPVYGGTYAFVNQMLPRAGITTHFITPEQAYEIEKHVPNANVIYFETPANPTTICIDIEAVVQAARRIGAKTVIDNTFASPINTLPLDWESISSSKVRQSLSAVTVMSFPARFWGARRMPKPCINSLYFMVVVPARSKHSCSIGA